MFMLIILNESITWKFKFVKKIFSPVKQTLKVNRLNFKSELIAVEK